MHTKFNAEGYKTEKNPQHSGMIACKQTQATKIYNLQTQSESINNHSNSAGNKIPEHPLFVCFRTVNTNSVS